MKNTFTLLFTLLFFALIAQAAAITGGTRLYLTPNANWKEADARFAAYYFGDGEAWASMTAVAGEIDCLHINFENGSKLVELYSISGQVILPQTYLNHFDRTLSEGMYILRIDGHARKLLVL